jgi:hypothetical protein
VRLSKTADSRPGHVSQYLQEAPMAEGNRKKTYLIAIVILIVLLVLLKI